MITIHLRECNGKFLLRVMDNGVGFPETLDYQNTETRGLQLINSLVMQLEGTVELIINDGSKFKIIF